MSLEKAILHKKEHRKPYPKHDSRNFDWSCRNNKSCGYCYANRTYSSRRKLLAAKLDARLAQW